MRVNTCSMGQLLTLIIVSTHASSQDSLKGRYINNSKNTLHDPMVDVVIEPTNTCVVLLSLSTHTVALTAAVLLVQDVATDTLLRVCINWNAR